MGSYLTSLSPDHQQALREQLRKVASPGTDLTLPLNYTLSPGRYGAKCRNRNPLRSKRFLGHLVCDLCNCQEDQ